VSAGAVNMVSLDGSKSGNGIINSDGTYMVNNAPIGDVKVTVTTPQVPEGAALAGTTGAATISVPERYNSPSTTDQTFKVEKGINSFDINLKSF
jgi:hypothetical protein